MKSGFFAHTGAPVLCAVLTALAALAQTPVAPAPDPNSPLAPVEDLDRQLRQYDPLAPDNDAAAVKARVQRDADRKREADHLPVSGSIADSESAAKPAYRDGPQIQAAGQDEDADSNVTPVYTGPAVLTRSYTLGRPELTKSMRWSESVSATSVYDTGLGRVGANGVTGTGGLIGTQMGWSFGGGHKFKHDSLRFATSGNFSLYGASSAYSGSNHVLTADWTHVISRRWTATTSWSGSTTSASSALLSQTAGPSTIANVNLAASPDIAVLDNGSKQMNLSTGVSWLVTNRLSASASAGWFVVDRNSPVLVGVSGESASGTVSYRFTRKMTVGATYSFTRYLYPHGVQTSDSQSAGAIFSYAFNHQTQVRFNGGLAHTEILGLETVQIDPIIALILGQTTGVIDAYRSLTNSNISAQFIRDFRHGGTASLAYARGISPGNGLFNTSMSETVSLSFASRFARRIPVSVSAARQKITGVEQALGAYTTEIVTLSTSRQLGHGASATLALNYRHFEIASLASLRNQFSIYSGITWGNANGRLWPF